jgi:asparagine synthase (glutamine-hydrolysing)
MCGIWGILSSKTISLDQVNLFNNFNKIKHRGPDKSIYITNSNYIIGFHRLAIIDTSIQGDQPFSHSYYYQNDFKESIFRTIYVFCNGEIYSHADIKSDPTISEINEKVGYKFKSNSDCEILLPLYLLEKSDDPNIGITKMLNRLNGEFAFGIFDIEQNQTTGQSTYNLWTGRDRFGIRPLFYTELDDYTVAFGSEVKSLIQLDGKNNNKIEVHDPRSWMRWSGIVGNKLEKNYKLYYAVGNLSMVLKPDLDDVYRVIRTTLINSVKSRLESDREIGCLLSGGLDSSLISAIAAKELALEGKKLRTFSIGMPDSPDVKFANIVANHIGSIHTNIEVPENIWIKSIEKIVQVTETFDITTIRASTGQYLISKWIADNTDIKVLLIGDGSDELTGGYLYFHRAPNPHQLHFECVRLLHYIHFFDVLRADRGIASNGLEARVPFLDHNFVDLYARIDLQLKMPTAHTIDGQTTKYEKYLLRKSFDSTDLLPKSVLWRRKEAFSDGVSSESKSWYQIIQERVNLTMSDEYFEINKKKYEGFLVPHTKEALYYHELFDKYYPEQYHLCPYYWLPKWIESTDPSARTLQVYKDVEISDQSKKSENNNINLIA